jgi:phosphoserine phosphatase
MIRLILVRHGQTDWNVQRRYQGHTDTRLNTVGKRQAEQIAARLVNIDIDTIYASDLQRAWETATTIAKKLALSPIPEPRLREMKFGVIEGLTFDEAQARYPEMIATWLADRNQPPTNGETLAAFSERIYPILDHLRHNHDGETVLLVAHGGPLLEIIRTLLRMPPTGRWYFKLNNASITQITLHDDTPVLQHLNDICHLREE